MRRFVLGWKVCGHATRLDAHIVNYADDFVICCQPGQAEQAMTVMREMMEKLRLTVNEKKTRRCVYVSGVHVWPTGVSENGAGVYRPGPSREEGPRDLQYDQRGNEQPNDVAECGGEVTQLNQILMGWGNYFRLGYVTGAWAVVQQHACRRLRWWLRRKHGQPGGVHGYPDLHLYNQYGLVKLLAAIRRLPLWA